jgi:hypothetical protein
MKLSTNLTEHAGDVNHVQHKVLFYSTLPNVQDSNFCLKFRALPVCLSIITFKMKMSMEKW